MLSLPNRISGLTVGLALVVGQVPISGWAQELDSDLPPEVWTSPLVAFEDSLGIQAPAHCLVDPSAESEAEGELDPAATMPAMLEIDPLRCPELLQFGGGPAVAAAPTWAASAWSFAQEYWYLLAAPMPLAFLGGGGGGGGGGGAPGMAAPDLSDSPSAPLESGPFLAPVRPIPEPSTWALLIVGGALVGAAARRRI